MKPKYIFGGIFAIALIVGGYFVATCKLSEHPSTASIYGVSTAKVSSRSASLPNQPATAVACQSSGNIFSSPVTAATYYTGSYLPVSWRVTSALPALPTNVSLSLVPSSVGSPIPFSQYSTATGITNNGSMSVSLTQGGNPDGIIPSSITPGQYYLQIQFTFAPGVLASGALGSVTCSGTFTITAPPICTPNFQYISKWGTLGTGSGQFNSPLGITTDSSGNMYVVDNRNNRIEKFNSSGTFITQWGGAGSANGQFNNPVGIAVSSSGNVYVADSYNSRIQEFNSSGSFIAKWGTRGTGNGQFYNPAGISIASSGNVYVVDSGYAGSYPARVQEFTSSGTYVTQWGSSGVGNNQFSNPYGIGVSPSGNVYVVDTFNNRIQEFTSSGSYMNQWGGPGSVDGKFSGPAMIAFDSAGNVYITDTGNNRVQEFSPRGTFIRAWGGTGSGNGQFNGPFGITIDSSGHVYVTDTGNNRVEKFGFYNCPTQ